MKTTEFIADLRCILAKLVEKGQSVAPINRLDEYLSQIERIANKNEAAQEESILRAQAKAHFEHDFEVWKVQAPLQKDHDIEMFRSVLEAGQTALKSATIINGGAAAALLAFLGNLLTKEAPQGTTFPISSISFAMLIFVIGVGCAGLAAGLRYLSQAAYKCDREKTGDVINFVTVALGLASFAAFFWGGIEAYMAIG